ncbi:MAG TPA: hypothetical protein VGR35_07100 [Tepidisphaeraceae bacterium]|nr:hypothetical protein [Tepidisphaeraceae bacterium]
MAGSFVAGAIVTIPPEQPDQRPHFYNIAPAGENFGKRRKTARIYTNYSARNPYSGANMTRSGLATILLGGMCISVLCLRVAGQQQPQQRPQAGNLQEDDTMVPPLWGAPPPQTRLEAIAAQKGVLITKGYTDIGEVQADDGSRLRVAAVSFADARESRERGVVVSIEQRGAEAPVIAFVDADEMQALAEALDALAKLDQGASPMANVEGVYRTRGDLEFTNHSSNGSRVVSARTTQILLPSGQVVQATATFRPARLAEIRQQIMMANEAVDHPQDAANK